MIEAIGELLAAIVGAFLEMVMHVLALLLSSSYMAAHAKGLSRFFYALTALAALHLLTGLVLAFSGAGPGLLLSGLFSGWALLASLFVVVIGIGAVVVLPSVALDDPTASKPAPPVFLSYLLSLVLIIGGLTIWSATTERRSITQKICDAASARVSDTWKARAESALGLSEDMLGRSLRDKLPCREPSE